ncbi:hypothetical protein [Novosphingobium album (ex Liu et al. 2023)]|uniref:Uncharacterized protein n=1 Tax=Novosphingobium album (ex Liu et al. 2023) TaxID=3031130 RepID=A0ABT5WXN4_9SPHN|nr:hypothetical protein [Novosphingobium album (ex Liu et al. 2023)]MDE8654629.1 hypothetical protein [Novosphingobium album (ex Liu et al. 2023)]
MRHVLTRQQLYDMIWERAVSKVAPELSISDVALRKQCVKHAIPLPDATYWGRLHAGRPVKRKPLGAAPKGVSDRIVIDARTKPPAPEPIEAAIAVARQSAEAVAVPERLHSLVAKTLAATRKAEPDRNGAITGLGGEVFRVRAHPDALDRVGAFLNALVYNAWPVAIGSKPDARASRWSSTTKRSALPSIRPSAGRSMSSRKRRPAGESAGMPAIAMIGTIGISAPPFPIITSRHRRDGDRDRGLVPV